MKMKITAEQYLSLQQENTELKAQLASVQEDYAALQSQLNWLKNQLFGRKSDKQNSSFPSASRSICTRMPLSRSRNQKP